MLFNSLQFLIFFPIVTLGYYLLPGRFRCGWLLIASCYFYMSFVPVYILILAAIIVIDYWMGLLIEDAPLRRKKLFLLVSLAANIGILCVFKYFNFLAANLSGISSVLLGKAIHSPTLDLLLPIGLSFHTFQSIAYIIEVYRGRQPAERNFGVYALYVMFYPQLVAGPIERPQHLLPQFKQTHEFRYDDFVGGMKLMAWGMFLKVVIADRLPSVVDPIFNNPTQYRGLPLLIASIAFTVQIFLDFAGYSYIAIGAARVMGIRLMTNFDRPFAATSISEFWKRWHISLSTWFRDYLYIPLGGNRVPQWRWVANVMIVFLLSGLWHGANWNFVIWGGLHGVYLVLAILIAPFVPHLLQDNSRSWVRVLNVTKVFALVCAAFVFFRAATFADAVHILGRMPRGLLRDISGFGADLANAIPPRWGAELALVGLGLCVIMIDNALRRRYPDGNFLSDLPTYVRWPAYYGLIYSTIIWVPSKTGPFIYFQF